MLLLLIRPTLPHCICPTGGVRAYCSECGYRVTFGGLLRDWEHSQPRPAYFPERAAAIPLRAAAIRLRAAASPPRAAAIPPRAAAIPPPAAAIPPPLADPPPPYAAAAPVATRSRTRSRSVHDNLIATNRANRAKREADAEAEADERNEGYFNDDSDEDDEGDEGDDTAPHRVDSDGNIVENENYRASQDTKRQRSAYFNALNRRK